jgi:DNA polymerase I-like protein with 3'-5' exonuclease and polymerase domains
LKLLDILTMNYGRCPMIYDIVVDLEVDLGGTRNDPTPYQKENKLAAIGWLRTDDNIVKIWEEGDIGSFKRDLESARYIICHNAKFDISWLRECGINVTGKIIDTMINQYILNRGVRGQLSLKYLAEYYDVTRKTNALETALEKGMNWSDLDHTTKISYLSADVKATAEIYKKQMEIFEREDSLSLVPIRDMMAEFCSVLTDIERAGMAIDMEVLDQVDKDYAEEEASLKDYLTRQVKELMGDLDVNLSSTEQLSQVIYSCRLIDKNKWKEIMNIGVDHRGKPLRRPQMSMNEFRHSLSSCFKRVKKVRSIQCPVCYGRGNYYKLKKDGEKFKKPTICPGCKGKGYIYKDLNDRAGLNIQPSVALASAGGFKTDKITLNAILQKTTDLKGRKFLESIVKLSAIETYRSSFIEGIKKGIKSDGLLHANFNQCTTATGRLSSSNPNLQNMPKGKLFPVRRAFVSRFDGGELIEIDYSQLEFRVAGILSHDPVIKKEVEEGFDVHEYTAQVLTKNGEKTERGPAKASTFRPLYGGSQGSPAQMAYFEEFFKKYEGVFSWHDRLQTEAITFKRLITATGRQFDFPYCERQHNGGASYKTQIVNYPVQSVATAEIVPLGVTLLFNKMKEMNLESKVINTVHDSVLIDTHPEEVDLIKKIGPQCLLDAQQEAFDRFGLDIYIPLGVDISHGKNWMEQEDFS